ncbi:RNA polymerase II transcriptional coactivator KIWI-like isoform X2 [Typha angustifolia]|uniref:RNA polymerase II transcriptional coactivator KIWI-like isoform X2 n=1 Tax=Typha angustifolia TaxID=59011 RepID=UPI003C2EA7E5
MTTSWEATQMQRVRRRGSRRTPQKTPAMASSSISKNRRVAVRSWQGKVVVDIREFYIKDGKQLPGKKGISLPMDQWKILLEHIEEIDEAVKENT